MLTGPIEDFPQAGIDNRAADVMQDGHAEDERRLGALIRQSGRRAGDFRHIWLARVLVELTPAINESMLRAGLNPELFVELGKDGMVEFLADLPASSAMFELRYRRHRDPKLPWTRRDLNDLNALAMAVVYCDVVVTERHMAALMREAKLDVRHKTIVLTDLRDLAGVLVAPSA